MLSLRCLHDNILNKNDISLQFFIIIVLVYIILCTKAITEQVAVCAVMSAYRNKNKYYVSIQKHFWHAQRHGLLVGFFNPLSWRHFSSCPFGTYLPTLFRHRPLVPYLPYFLPRPLALSFGTYLPYFPLFTVVTWHCPLAPTYLTSCHFLYSTLQTEAIMLAIVHILSVHVNACLLLRTCCFGLPVHHPGLAILNLLSAVVGFLSVIHHPSCHLPSS
jgi:hypothetical protein